LEKMGWKDKTLSVTGNVSMKNRHRLRQNPAVIPVAGWQTGAKVSQDPDYRWRLRFASDESKREGEQLENDLDPLQQDALKKGYREVVAQHLQQFIAGVSRRMVWPSHMSM